MATCGQELVGFLVGAPKAGQAWGANVWIDAAGQAVTEPEVVRDLYAMAAARWAAQSRTAHYVLVPASDHDLLAAWYRLGFGQQQAHGVRPLPMAASPAPTAVAVRPARRSDLPALARLELELKRHQRLAPTFSAATVPSHQDSLAGWAEDFEDPAYATFVAEVDGVIVGSGVGCPLRLAGNHPPLSQPEHAAFLTFVAVFPHARGLGAGRALGEAVMGPRR